MQNRGPRCQMRQSLKDSIILRLRTQAEIELARDIVDQVGARSYRESNKRAHLVVAARDIELLLEYLRVAGIGYSPLRNEQNTLRSLAARRLCKRAMALARHVRRPLSDEMNRLSLTFYGTVEVPLETYGERRVAERLQSVTDCSVSSTGLVPRLVVSGHCVPTMLDHLDSIVSSCANPSEARSATNLRGRLTGRALDLAKKSESRLREFEIKRRQQFRKKKG